MNRRPLKLKLYDELALLLATTGDERTALVCWRCMRMMLPPKLHLFAVKPTMTKVGDRDIVNEQIDRMVDAGATYSSIAQALRLDWRRVKQQRDWWLGLTRGRTPGTSRTLAAA